MTRRRRRPRRSARCSRRSRSRARRRRRLRAARARSAPRCCRSCVDDTATLVDTCGTGGGSFSTFNISTAAALVAAGAGVRIAKHGNRSHSSRCGSADVLESLGVDIQPSPAVMRRMLDHAGIVFMFAPAMHPGDATRRRRATRARRADDHEPARASRQSGERGAAGGGRGESRADGSHGWRARGAGERARARGAR